MTQPAGEIFDLGYQHYDGPREGRMRARKAVYMNGVRTTLGLGHGSLAKVLPVLLFASAMAPAIILALVASQVNILVDSLPKHSDYYQMVSIILLLFSAIIGPELLCPDRRNGVISLYLVRPLTPTDYVASRWAAFFSITLVLVYSGQIVLLVGLVLAANDPGEYLRENWLDIPRILGAGFLVALFTTTIPLAVSAFTNRRAYAAAFVIGLFIISAAFAGALTECEDDGRGSGSSSGGCERLTGDGAKWLGLIDLGRVPTNVNDMIFDDDDRGERGALVAELPEIVPIGWYLLLTGGPALLLWLSYRRMTL